MVSITGTQPSPCAAQENFVMDLHSKIIFYFSSGNQDVLTDIMWIFVNHMMNDKLNL